MTTSSNSLFTSRTLTFTTNGITASITDYVTPKIASYKSNLSHYTVYTWFCSSICLSCMWSRAQINQNWCDNFSAQRVNTSPSPTSQTKKLESFANTSPSLNTLPIIRATPIHPSSIFGLSFFIMYCVIIVITNFLCICLLYCALLFSYSATQPQTCKIRKRSSSLNVINLPKMTQPRRICHST